MRSVDRVFEFFVETSESYSGTQWISILAGLSFVTYLLIVSGGRGR
jgi:hypothetical protein